jgi:hypothetical protein
MAHAMEFGGGSGGTELGQAWRIGRKKKGIFYFFTNWAHLLGLSDGKNVTEGGRNGVGGK